MRPTLWANLFRASAFLSSLFVLLIAISACSSAVENLESQQRAGELEFQDSELKNLAQNTNDCPPASTLPNKVGWELATASYTARQDGETVTVTATGENSTAAFKVQLAREPMKIFPPKLAFYRKPPDGFAAQVITPFTVCIAFQSRQPVSAVTVRDSRGEHRIQVMSSR
jgi:hypothetical protein